MPFYITKASGKQELFSVDKFRKSLHKAGADDQTIARIVADLETKPELRSTHEIYAFALDHLHKQNPSIASRYAIKRALFELGPAGFSFEKFIGALFKVQGYSIQEDLVVRGACVEHELDVVALKNDDHIMIECKFHNRQGLTCDVKVPLYVQARFQDIETARKHDAKNPQFNAVWVATNTRFTTEAVTYGECIGIKLLSWDYPAVDNIPNLIDRYHLHPVTALVSLTHRQKGILIKNGLVLCKDLIDHEHKLASLGFSPLEINELISNAKKTCNL